MSVRMGASQIFWTCIVLLEFAYSGAVVVGILSPVRSLLTCCMFIAVAEGCCAAGWRCNSVHLKYVAWQVWWSKISTVVTHAFMGALLYWRARRTDLTDSKAIYDCYMCVCTRVLFYF